MLPGHPTPFPNAADENVNFFEASFASVKPNASDPIQNHPVNIPSTYFF